MGRSDNGLHLHSSGYLSKQPKERARKIPCNAMQCQFLHLRLKVTVEDAITALQCMPHHSPEDSMHTITFSAIGICKGLP